MATDKNFVVKNGLEVGGQLIVNSSGQLEITTVVSDLHLQDNIKAKFGLGSDLYIQHTGSESQIFNSTGQLDIRSSTRILLSSSAGENMARFTNNGAAELFYDNAVKLATKSDGVDITGELQSDSLDVDGNADISGNLVLGGDLTVNGTTTTINSTTLSVDDKNIVIADGTSSSTDADGAGIIINGPTNNASLLWDHANQYLELNKSLFTQASFIIGTTATNVGRMYNSSGVMALEAYTTRQISFGNADNGEHVRIDADGNVGIGTTDPNSLLHVSHATAPTFRLSRTGTGQVWVQSIDSSGRFQLAEAASEGGTQNIRLQVDDTGEITFNGAYTFPTADGSANQVLQTDGSGNLSFADASGGGVTISNNANNRVLTGDGTNANAEANLTFDGSTLDVTGRLDVSQDLRIRGGSGSGDVGVARLHVPDSAGSISFDAGNDGTNMILTSTGLGIGTTSPSQELHVVGNIIANGINHSNGNEVIDLDHATYTIFKDPEGANRLHLGDSGDTGNYYSNSTHHVRSANGQTYFTTTNSSGFNVRSGAIKIDGTNVIDSSRNLSNIGTVSSGVTTITSSGTIGGNTPSNGYLKITDGTNTLAFDANEIHTTDNLYLNAEDGIIYLRGNDSGAVTLKNGAITFMDTTRNLSNIGTISSGAITTSAALQVQYSGMNNISLSPTSTGGVINARNSSGTSVVVMDGRGTPFIDVTGNLKTGGTTRIDSSGNLSNIGTISSGAITSSGRIKTTNGLFQADEGDQKLRQYEISTADAGGSFLLGKIEHASSTDGGVEGIVRFAYDYGSTTNNCAIHFNFAQRSGAARGTWWYEHDDQEGAADRVHVRLIDDGSGGMFVWVTSADYSKVFIEAKWRQCASVTDSGSLTAGTLTTGTTLFDTANDPTSEMHIGRLYAHDHIFLPDSKVAYFGTGNDLQIWHSSTNSLIDHTGTGSLFIRNTTNDSDIIFQTDDGSGGLASYFYLDGGNTNINFEKDLYIKDNVEAQFGTGSDLKIYHNATDSFIFNNTGNLYLRNSADDQDILLQSDDGSGGTHTYFQLDGSQEQLKVHKNMVFFDNVKAYFGGGADFSIYHDATDSYIENATGNIEIRNNTDDGDIIFRSDNGSGGLTQYLRLDGGITKTVFSQDSKHLDNIKALFGTDDDLRIQHTGSAGYVANYTGTLSIQNNTDDGDVVIQSDDGSGSVANYFMADGSSGSANLYHYGSLKLNTSSSGITVTGGATFSGNCTFSGSSNQIGGTMDFLGDVLFEGNNTSGILFDISDDAFEFSDNARAKFGNSSDLAIYHDGSNSYITEGGTGDLLIQSNNSIRLRATSGENMIQGIADGAVTLYYDNSAKLATTSTGVTVTGLLSATTKSFDIPHPSKEDWRLRYGSLEGPENGVYVRGKSQEKVILLPDYWVDLVHEDSITVQLTAIGGGQNLYVEDIKDNKVYVNGENYFYYIQAERKDVDKLEVEYERTDI